MSNIVNTKEALKALTSVEAKSSIMIDDAVVPFLTEENDGKLNVNSIEAVGSQLSAIYKIVGKVKSVDNLDVNDKIKLSGLVEGLVVLHHLATKVNLDTTKYDWIKNGKFEISNAKKATVLTNILKQARKSAQRVIEGQKEVNEMTTNANVNVTELNNTATTEAPKAELPMSEEQLDAFVEAPEAGEGVQVFETNDGAKLAVNKEEMTIAVKADDGTVVKAKLEDKGGWTATAKAWLAKVWNCVKTAAGWAIDIAVGAPLAAIGTVAVAIGAAIGGSFVVGNVTNTAIANKASSMFNGLKNKFKAKKAEKEAEKPEVTEEEKAALA